VRRSNLDNGATFVINIRLCMAGWRVDNGYDTPGVSYMYLL